MAITGADLVKKMQRGINIGQCFEARQNSREPTHVRALLKSFKDAGFDSVRIPVTWWGSDHKTCNLNDTTFMSQLDNAIHYAVSLGLVVVINTHHEKWIDEEYEGLQWQNDIFWAHWKKLAERYKSIPQDKLILQVKNEPKIIFGSSAHETNPDDPNRLELTRLLNKTGYDGVRSVDKTRIIAIMPNNMANIYRCSPNYPTKDSLPRNGNDPYLIMSCHSYDGWSLCGQTGSVNGMTSQKLRQDIDKRFDMVQAWQKKMDNGIGVLITECGIGRLKKSDLDHNIIREYYKETGRRAREAGFGVMIWCDGTNSWFTTYDYNLNTKRLTWIYGLKDAFINK